jgi:hypothetical protein
MAIASELILSTGTTPATPSAGKAAFYFDSTVAAPGLKVIDSSGNTYSLSGSQTSIGMPSKNDFRLTGVTLTPVMTADNSGSLSTIYLTPFKGAQIALYNGSGWDTLASAEVSLGVTARTADLPFDVFAYNSSGTVTLEFLDWTNATTRATALVRQDGIWCKTGALTRRYVGSCRPRSATAFAWTRGGVDAPAKFDLFNADNRVNAPFSLIASTDSWTYTTATWRQAQASLSYQVDIMVGLQEEGFFADLACMASNATANVDREVGIGFDSTSAFTGICNGHSSNTSSGTGTFMMTAAIANLPAIGRHFYAWLEISTATGTTTWYGDNAALRRQSGMVGTWTC